MKYHRWYYKKDIFYRNASPVSLAQRKVCPDL